VPAGKALLIPVLNLGYFAFPDDPPATRTEAYVREQVSSWRPPPISPRQSTSFRPNIKNATSRNLHCSRSSSREQRLWPSRWLPLDPSVDAGYYLVVKPLARQATIHFTGSNGGFSSDITYFITIAARMIRTATATEAALSIERWRRCVIDRLHGATLLGSEAVHGGRDLSVDDQGGRVIASALLMTALAASPPALIGTWEAELNPKLVLDLREDGLARFPGRVLLGRGRQDAPARRPDKERTAAAR